MTNQSDGSGGGHSGGGKHRLLAVPVLLGVVLGVGALAKRAAGRIRHRSVGDRTKDMARESLGRARGTVDHARDTVEERARGPLQRALGRLHGHRKRHH